MVEVFTTADFDQWLRKLKDRQGRLRILARIDRLAHGNSGDVKTVGRGALELRLTYGPGYRVYYAQRQPDRAPAVRRRQVKPAEGHRQGTSTRRCLAVQGGWRQ